MAQFGGMELTNAGRNLLAKALSGKTLKFTKGVAGDGYLPENQEISELTNVISPHRDMQIEDINIPPYIGTAKISVVMSNKELVQGFFFREIGLFAEDPDTGNEVLYGYCNSGNTADYMPGQDGPDAVYYRFDLTVVVDQAKEVTAIFSDNPLSVTYVQLNKSVDEIYRYIREREAFLQHQIDCLSKASIKNSIEHIGQKHWQSQEA